MKKFRRRDVEYFSRKKTVFTKSILKINIVDSKYFNVFECNSSASASNHQQIRTYFFKILLDISHQIFSEFIPRNVLLNLYNSTYIVKLLHIKILLRYLISIKI